MLSNILWHRSSTAAKAPVSYSITLALLLSFSLHAALIVALRHSITRPTPVPNERIVQFDLIERAEPPNVIATTATSIEPSVAARPPAKMRRAKSNATPVAPKRADSKAAPRVAAGNVPEPATQSALLATHTVSPVSDTALAVELNVLDWLARYRIYPLAARRARLEGTVHLSVVLMPDGSLVDQRVEQSSGHALLDRSALELLARASPLPSASADPRAQKIELHLPVVYRMNTLSSTSM